MKRAVAFDRTPKNRSAYAPDLPRCVATGGTREEVERHIREAIAFHLEELREDNEPIPEPSAWTTLVEVQAQPGPGGQAVDGVGV